METIFIESNELQKLLAIKNELQMKVIPLLICL